MAVEFRDAESAVEAVARELILAHHKHLQTAEIRYLFRTGGWQSKGRTTLGKTKKLSAQDEFLIGADFVVTINHDEWMRLATPQRKALLDHELSHCGVDEHGWVLYAHDLEEFRAVVHRNGLWDDDLQRMDEAMAPHRRQITLFDGKGPVEPAPAGARELLHAVGR